MLTKYASLFLKLVAGFILGEKWNDTLTGTKQECRNLFKSAKHNIRIVAGELQHEVFEDDQIIAVLEDLSTRDKDPITIEIIHGPNPDPKSKRIFELQKKAKGRVSIMKAPKRPATHFVLVDGSSYRVEKYHKAREPERMAYMKTKHPLFINRILARKFDDLTLTIKKSGI